MLPAVCSAGSNGCWVVQSTSSAFYLQRVNPDGSLRWSVPNRYPFPASYLRSTFNYFKILQDGRNGFYLSFGDTTDLYIQRFDQNGTPLWSNNTVAFRGLPYGNQEIAGFELAAPDTFFLLFHKDSAHTSLHFVQKITGIDSASLLWGNRGIAVVDSEIPLAYGMSLTADGAGGCITGGFYYESRTMCNRYRLIQISNNSTGATIRNFDLAASVPYIVTSLCYFQQGHLLALWHDNRSGYADVYRTVFDSTMTPLPGFVSTGLLTRKNRWGVSYENITVIDPERFMVSWIERKDNYSSRFFYSIYETATGHRITTDPNGTFLPILDSLPYSQSLNTVTTSDGCVMVMAIDNSIYLSKIDRNGTRLWHTSYGATSAETAISPFNFVCADQNGGIYISYRYMSSDNPNRLHLQHFSSTGQRLLSPMGAVLPGVPLSYTVPLVHNNQKLYTVTGDLETDRYRLRLLCSNESGDTLWTRVIWSAQISSLYEIPRPKLIPLPDGVSIHYCDRYADSTYSNVYGQRYLENGTPVWGDPSIVVGRTQYYRYSAVGTSNAIWYLIQDSISMIARKIFLDGRIAFGDTGIRLPRSLSELNISYFGAHSIYADRDSGVFVGWYDHLNDRQHKTYFTHLNSDGSYADPTVWNYYHAGRVSGSRSGMIGAYPDQRGGLLLIDFSEDYVPDNLSRGEIYIQRIADHTTLAVRESNSNALPDVFRLDQNYPNPFNAVTSIRYHLSIESSVELRLFDIQGRLVQNLFNSIQQAGDYRLQFNAQRLASGTYFLRMNSGDFSKVRKIVLLK